MSLTMSIAVYHSQHNGRTWKNNTSDNQKVRQIDADKEFNTEHIWWWYQKYIKHITFSPLPAGIRQAFALDPDFDYDNTELSSKVAESRLGRVPRVPRVSSSCQGSDDCIHLMDESCCSKIGKRMEMWWKYENVAYSAGTVLIVLSAWANSMVKHVGTARVPDSCFGMRWDVSLPASFQRGGRPWNRNARARGWDPRGCCGRAMKISGSFRRTRKFMTTYDNSILGIEHMCSLVKYKYLILLVYAHLSYCSSYQKLHDHAGENTSWVTKGTSRTSAAQAVCYLHVEFGQARQKR